MLAGCPAAAAGPRSGIRGGLPQIGLHAASQFVRRGRFREALLQLGVRLVAASVSHAAGLRLAGGRIAAFARAVAGEFARGVAVAPHETIGEAVAFGGIFDAVPGVLDVQGRGGESRRQAPMKPIAAATSARSLILFMMSPDTASFFVPATARRRPAAMLARRGAVKRNSTFLFNVCHASMT